MAERSDEMLTQRAREILALAEARLRPSLAREIVEETDLSLEAAQRILQAAPVEIETGLAGGLAGRAAPNPGSGAQGVGDGATGGSGSRPSGPPASAPAMGLAAAIRLFFSRYFDFQGRSRRAEFWWVALVQFVGLYVISLLDALVPAGIRVGFPAGFLLGNVLIGPLYSAFVLVTFIPQLSLSVRRLHDTGRSGWWGVLPGLPLFAAVFLLIAPNLVADLDLSIFLIVVPAALLFIAASIALLIWFLSPSQPGPNRFGPNPLEI